MAISPALCVIAVALASSAWADTPADHFEKKVRPLLMAKCVGCHGPEKQKAGLRIDAAGLAKGGDSGPAVVAGMPDESLLVSAIRYGGEPRMPPDGKLKDQEIADIEAWVKAGAVWPDAPASAASAAPSVVKTLEPNAPSLKPHLQAWYRADTLPLADGAKVHVWPDSGGRGRDLSATAGVRPAGVGQPATYIAASGVHRRPAVRFDPETGLATSPDAAPEIRGDAALTILLVMNLRPTDVPHPHDGILGIGDPANPSDPGKPLAALVQISRTPEAELKLAGGWNHDATLGKGSFQSLWNRPLMLTVVKSPGPIGTTTRFFVDGRPSQVSPLGRKVAGSAGIPDIRSRKDIGLYMGKALAWCGSIRGEVSEAIVYGKVLSDEDRTAVEIGLGERYGFLHPAVLALSRATFKPEQKTFWAFQPVKAVASPSVKDEARVKSPIDRFLIAKLEAAGIEPSPAAEKVTLIRRATFDLTGLPPTPEEVDAFVKDESPDAFAKVVDRLLDSQHYGEHWGRHWLDVVRYAESTANDANAVMRYAWRYRDYVVRAFNEDEPYDRFLVEQLAGDLLPTTGNLTRDAEQVIATGYLMIGPKALAEPDKEQSRLDIVDDQIDVTGRAMLGLTVGCARCHDHKFDPIPTTDYYGWAGIFRSTEVFRDENRNATMWQEWPLLQLPGEKPVMVMAPKEGRPTNLRVALRGNRQTPGVPAPRRYLQIIAGEGHAPIETTQSGRLELARWIASKDNPLTARVMVNRVWQHHFGTGLVETADNLGARGEKPSHPELLDWLANEFVASGWSVKKLHRLIMASAAYQASLRASEKALRADPNNRLLGRFTRQRLPAESVRDAMLAVSGRLDRAVGGSDSGELLFAVGEAIREDLRPNRLQTDHPIYTTSVRRSLYLPVVRNAIPDVTALFDGADPNGVTAVRNDTTVAPQSLFLMNHPFVKDQAAHFAKRLLDDAKATDSDRVMRAYRLALGRPPESTESAETAELLARYQEAAKGRGMRADEARSAAWRGFCWTLICRNEFLYVD